MASWDSQSRPSSSPFAYRFLLLLTLITSEPRSGQLEPSMAGTQIRTNECTSTQITKHLLRCRSFGVKGKKTLNGLCIGRIRSKSTFANSNPTQRRAIEFGRRRRWRRCLRVEVAPDLLQVPTWMHRTVLRHSSQRPLVCELEWPVCRRPQ